MIANFYILAESFAHNHSLSLGEIESRVYALSDDIILIQRNRDENKIFANFDELYQHEFYSTVKLWDIITRQINIRELLGHDLFNILIKIFEKCTSTTLTTLDIKDTLLGWHDEEVCHGFIAFNRIESIDENFQIIYNKNNWFSFRRYFLSLYPRNENYYIDECKKYFNNLYFHSRNKSTIAPILNDFAINITKHLGFLNDTLSTYNNRHFDNESVKYQAFTAECDLDADAASKDSNDAKDTLTYEFENFKGEIIFITCYPHLKLCKSDNPGDSKYYFYRIYFHVGEPEVENGKILIGHIGYHRP